MKSKIFALIAVLVLGAGFSAQALALEPTTYGDDDPIPVFCVNFAGNWRADDGDSYSIQQKKCGWIKISAMAGGGVNEHTTTIVPDGKTRLVEGDSWKAKVRHKWNARDYGASIQTMRTIEFADRTVSESILLELANGSLLSETTYRITVFKDNDEPLRESFQRLYRRASMSERDESKERKERPIKRK